MSYPSYAEMKDSGVEWLGEVPKHWDAKRLKFCVELINDKSDSLPDEMKYVGLENIKSKTGELLLNGESEGAEGACNLFKAGDVLFGKLRPYLAKALLAEFDGACTTELLVMRPQLVAAKYLLSYILSENFINTVDGSTYGAKMPRASWDFIGNMPQLIPPLEQQQAIAAFLDRKTAELDELIRLKERQIELLGAKRQALISQAVTRGLDPSVKMRPSGIEWLGDIPAHWQMLSVRHLIQRQDLEIQDGNHGELHPVAKDYIASGIPFVMANNIRGGKVHFDDCHYISEEQALGLRIGFAAPDDVLLTHKGTLGETAIVPKSIPYPFLMLTPQVTYYRATSKLISPHYLYYFFSSVFFANQIGMIASVQSTRGYVGLLAQKEFRILLPPIIEQNQIADHLLVKTQGIDETIEKIALQIDYLREYRQALISAAVTGKIDVRGVSV